MKYSVVKKSDNEKVSGHATEYYAQRQAGYLAHPTCLKCRTARECMTKVFTCKHSPYKLVRYDKYTRKET